MWSVDYQLSDECQVYVKCHVITPRYLTHLLSDSCSLQCQETLDPHLAPALLHLLPVLLLQGRQGAHRLPHLPALAELLQEGGHLAAVLAVEGGQVQGGGEQGAGVEGQELG